MSITVKVADEQGVIFNIDSFTSDETYSVAVNENNEWFCSCYDYYYYNKNNNCKHIRECKKILGK